MFKKQTWFCAGHSPEHTLLDLVNQISNTFNEKNYLLDIFIDLSKAFNAGEHKILIHQTLRIKRDKSVMVQKQKQYINYDSNANNINNNNNNINNNNNKDINCNLRKLNY